MDLSIRYITRPNIDAARWDNAIAAAHNGRIYATSAYLDAMCEFGWDALVAGDYEVVMPLPCRRKWGIHYVFIPPFVQQLGVFSADTISSKTVAAFIAAIPKHYSYCDLVLNSGNKSESAGSILRKNYLLSLAASYETLKAAYSRSANRNMAKAASNGIVIEGNTSSRTTIRLHRQRFGNKIGPGKRDYERLEDLLTDLTRKGACISFTAKLGDSVIASSTYLLYQERLIFLLNGNTKESLENGATHLLKDAVIRRFAGTPLVLDFEGSDHPSFARFYKQFGAQEIEYYPHLVLNRLPRLLQWLKRSEAPQY